MLLVAARASHGQGIEVRSVCKNSLRLYSGVSGGWPTCDNYSIQVAPLEYQHTLASSPGDEANLHMGTV